MITVVISTLVGAGIGALISVLLYVLGFCAELVNCACQIITFDCNGGDLIPTMWQNSTFFNVLIFCSICGAVIGFIFGIFAEKLSRDEALAKRNAELSEEARKQSLKETSEQSIEYGETEMADAEKASEMVGDYSEVGGELSSELQESGQEFQEIAEESDQVNDELQSEYDQIAAALEGVF